MTYIDPVKWPDAHEKIRLKMLAQPRGYQAQVAKKIGKTPGFINQIVTGRCQIPIEHLDAVLESLNLGYDVTITEED